MRANRLWVETVAFSTAIAFALALLIATLATTTAVLLESPAFGQEATSSTLRQRTFEGMVTCTRCGAKHAAKMGKTADDCARECVQSGASFALVDGDRTLPLTGDPVLLKKFAGQRARVIGAVQGKTIEVSSIAPVD